MDEGPVQESLFQGELLSSAVEQSEIGQQRLARKFTMKKQYRSIIIGSDPYAWVAFSVVDECEIPCVRVKIWKDKNTLIFDEVWKHQMVKPSMIADKIKTLIANVSGEAGEALSPPSCSRD